jgi:hypothetical protein
MSSKDEKAEPVKEDPWVNHADPYDRWIIRTDRRHARTFPPSVMKDGSPAQKEFWVTLLCITIGELNAFLVLAGVLFSLNFLNTDFPRSLNEWKTRQAFRPMRLWYNSVDKETARLNQQDGRIDYQLHAALTRQLERLKRGPEVEVRPPIDASYYRDNIRAYYERKTISEVEAANIAKLHAQLAETQAKARAEKAAADKKAAELEAQAYAQQKADAMAEIAALKAEAAALKAKYEAEAEAAKAKYEAEIEAAKAKAAAAWAEEDAAVASSAVPDVSMTDAELVKGRPGDPIFEANVLRAIREGRVTIQMEGSSESNVSVENPDDQMEAPPVRDTAAIRALKVDVGMGPRVMVPVQRRVLGAASSAAAQQALQEADFGESAGDEQMEQAPALPAHQLRDWDPEAQAREVELVGAHKSNPEEDDPIEEFTESDEDNVRAPAVQYRALASRNMDSKHVEEEFHFHGAASSTAAAPVAAAAAAAAAEEVIDLTGDDDDVAPVAPVAAAAAVAVAAPRREKPKPKRKRHALGPKHKSQAAKRLGFRV